MPFTYSYSAIPQSSTDPDSPLDTILMDGLRQNDGYLLEYIGQGFTPAPAHQHNGTDSHKVDYANLAGTAPTTQTAFFAYSGGGGSAFNTGAIGFTPKVAFFTVSSHDHDAAATPTDTYLLTNGTAKGTGGSDQMYAGSNISAPADLGASAYVMQIPNYNTISHVLSLVQVALTQFSASGIITDVLPTSTNITITCCVIG